MSKQNRSKKKKKKRAEVAESKATEALTVAWMLSMMATLAALIGAWGTWLLAVWFVAGDPDAKRVNLLLTLPGMLLFIAIVTGVVCLILGPLARRLRLQAVPSQISIFAFLVGIAPLVTLVIFALANLR